MGNVTIQGGASTPVGYVLLQPAGGKVGIGTSTPAYPLHVIGVTGIGDGTIRMGGTAWGESGAVNIGISNTVSYNNSTALGNSNNTGAGDSSTAIGFHNSAAADASTAVGFYNSSGQHGTAVGYMNSASQMNGVAIGVSNTLSAANTIAIGNSITNAIASSLMIGPSRLPIWIYADIHKFSDGARNQLVRQQHWCRYELARSGYVNQHRKRDDRRDYNLYHGVRIRY